MTSKINEILRLFSPRERIMGSGHLRTKDLKALCLVSKAFNAAASPFLYQKVYVSSGWAAMRALASLAGISGISGQTTAAKAPFVQSLVLMGSREFHPRDIGSTPQLLRHTLPLMTNLTFLYIAEQWEIPAQIFAYSTYSPTVSELDASVTPAIVSKPPFPFHLTDLRLYGMPLEPELIEFLSSQSSSLRSLTFWDPPPTEDNFVLPGTTGGLFNRSTSAFEKLFQFDGTILLASELLSVGAPLVNLCAGIEPKEDAVEIVRYVLPLIGNAGKTLKGLKLTGIPGPDWSHGGQGQDVKDVAGEVVVEVLRRCQELRYLGVIPLSWKDRSQIHKGLMDMRCLKHLEVFIDGWIPMPNVFALKAISAEFRVYCPSLRVILYTFPGNQHVAWVYEPGQAQWRMNESVRYNWDDIWVQGGAGV